MEGRTLPTDRIVLFGTSKARILTIPSPRRAKVVSLNGRTTWATLARLSSQILEQ